MVFGLSLCCALAGLEATAGSWLRFTVQQCIGGGSWVQLSELAVYDAATNRINAGLSAVADGTAAADLTAMQASGYCAGGVTQRTMADSYEGLANLFDNSTGTKFARAFANGIVSSIETTWVLVTMRLADDAVPALYNLAVYDEDVLSSRSPISWKVETSGDGETWTLVDVRKGVSYPTRSVLWYNDGNPYAFNGGEEEKTTSSAWLRFTIRKANSAWDRPQFSEFATYDWEGARNNLNFAYAGNGIAAAELADGQVTCSVGGAAAAEGPANLFDGNTGTKLYAGSLVPVTLTIRYPNTSLPYAYDLASANDSLTTRAPISWTAEFSTNATDWLVADVRDDVTPPTKTQTYYVGGTHYAFTNYAWNAFAVTLERESYVYASGNVYTPAVTVVDPRSGTTLAKDTDYSVAYADNDKVGTASVTVTGLGDYAVCKRKAHFEILPGYVIYLPVASGTTDLIVPCEPEVVVSNYNGTTLLERDVDYSLEYADNLQVGTGRVTVRGLGPYAGSVDERTFAVGFAYQRLPARYWIAADARPDWPVWRDNTYLIHDDDCGSYCADTSYSFYLDFGAPRKTAYIAIAPRIGLESRAKSLKAYGSNDLKTWTVVHTNTAALTGGKLNYFLCAGWDGTSSYRYMKVNNSDQQNVAEVWFAESGTIVEATADATVFESVAVEAADVTNAQGLATASFSGKVRQSADPVRVRAFAALRDYGDDYAAWLAHGIAADLGDKAAGTAFAGTFTGLGPGLWHWRIFADDADGHVSCQPTAPFAVGTRTIFPKAYVKTAKVKYCYDGNRNYVDDSDGSGIVFDLGDLRSRGLWLDGVRAWQRTGFYARLLAAYVDYGWDPADGEVTWDVMSHLLTGTRVVDQVSAFPSDIVWESDVAHFLFSSACLSTTATYLPLQNWKKGRPPRYLRLRGFSNGNIAEIEIRARRFDPGTRFCVR